MVQLLSVQSIVTNLTFCVVFAHHWYAAWQESDLVLTDNVGSRRLAITLLMTSLIVAHLGPRIAVLHEQVAFMEIALILTLDSPLFEGLVTFSHLDDIPVETAVEGSDLAFGNSIARASSLLLVLLHAIMGLYAGLFPASAVRGTTIPFGRVILLNLHGVAHGGIRNLRWV